MTAAVPTSIAVAICTYRRPDQLLRGLRRIAEEARRTQIDRITIVVADDDPEGSAEAAVTGATNDHAGIELRYVRSGSSNISTARNTAIETAMTCGEFVACIDDDCVPDDHWLNELVRIAGSTAADLVVGHREFIAPAAAPAWLSNEGFLVDNERYADGSVPPEGNVANILIRSAWLANSGVRFRQQLGVCGGEDMVFLQEARSLTANIRFAEFSVVREPYEGHRLSFSYQCWRQVWLGNNEAAINRRTRRTSPVRLVARGWKRIAHGFVLPWIQLLRGQRPEWRRSFAIAARGAGLLLGVAGTELRHRS
jgi:succinoglycan biosynthesis protein ExoM